jgi:LDH2 family malate/lactate/ureidoglycolate dehydrogenase
VNPTFEELKSYTESVLTAVGVGAEAAAETADVLVTTDAMGVFTHGTKLLSGYVRKLQGGGYRSDVSPLIERQGPGWAVVDGQSALGQVGSQFCIDLAMEKAADVGVAYVGLRNTGHIGAAGYYTQKAARQGFITMVTGNDMPSVAAPGSKGPVLGSNPIAYGAPVPGQNPINLDIATAAVAGGKVYAAHQRGEQIPDSWLIDRDGKPTSDGSLYPANASLAPMAGHKGYGFGLWCEILSGALPGGHMTWDIGSWMFDPTDQPSYHNAGFMVIDTKVIADADGYATRMHKLIEEIHAVETAEGVEQVILPGEREWASVAQSLKTGIDLPADVRAKLAETLELVENQPAWLQQ